MNFAINLHEECLLQFLMHQSPQSLHQQDKQEREAINQGLPDNLELDT